MEPARSLNYAKRRLAISNGIRNQMAVKSGQLAFARASKGEQIGVGYLRGIEEPRRVHELAEERDVIGPELMTIQGAEDREQLGHGRRGSRRICVSCMAHNTKNPVFCERTGRPSLLAERREPSVRPVMLHMCRID